MKLFLQKNAKFSSAGGSAPRLPCLRRLGAEPPDPHWPPAAGVSTPRPPKQPPLRISGYALAQMVGQMVIICCSSELANLDYRYSIPIRSTV